MSKEVQTTAVNTTFAPETPIVAETRRGWKPLGFLSVLRNVPVQTPCWLFVIRSVQTLLAGVVIACLVWNLTVNDFSGVSIHGDDFHVGEY